MMKSTFYKGTTIAFSCYITDAEGHAITDYSNTVISALVRFGSNVKKTWKQDAITVDKDGNFVFIWAQDETLQQPVGRYTMEVNAQVLGGNRIAVMCEEFAIADSVVGRLSDNNTVTASVAAPKQSVTTPNTVVVAIMGNNLAGESGEYTMTAALGSIINGKSAYEQYVEAGGTMTEEEYINAPERAEEAAAAAAAAAGNATTATNNATTATTAANNAATLANGKATDANAAAIAANNGATAANQAAEAAEAVVTTYDDVINALAHSDCSLEQRITTLESLLAAVFSGGVVVPALKVTDLLAQNTDIVRVGVGAPSIIPDRAGQFYINTTAKTLYHSTGNSAISDWNLA